MKMKKIIHLCNSYSVTKNAIYENVIFEIIGKKMKKDLRYFPWWVPSLKVCVCVGGGGYTKIDMSRWYLSNLGYNRDLCIHVFGLCSECA